MDSCFSRSMVSVGFETVDYARALWDLILIAAAFCSTAIAPLKLYDYIDSVIPPIDKCALAFDWLIYPARVDAAMSCFLLLAWIILLMSIPLPYMLCLCILVLSFGGSWLLGFIFCCWGTRASERRVKIACCCLKNSGSCSYFLPGTEKCLKSSLSV